MVTSTTFQNAPFQRVPLSDKELKELKSGKLNARVSQSAKTHCLTLKPSPTKKKPVGRNQKKILARPHADVPTPAREVEENLLLTGVEEKSILDKRNILHCRNTLKRYVKDNPIDPNAQIIFHNVAQVRNFIAEYPNDMGLVLQVLKRITYINRYKRKQKINHVWMTTYDDIMTVKHLITHLNKFTNRRVGEANMHAVYDYIQDTFSKDEPFTYRSFKPLKIENKVISLALKSLSFRGLIKHIDTNHLGNQIYSL